MVHQFAHIKLMKHAGCRNVSNRIAMTVPGRLALMCPACLCPGINLPPDWESAPLEYKYGWNLTLKNQTLMSLQVSVHLDTGPGCEFLPQEPIQIFMG